MRKELGAPLSQRVLRVRRAGAGRRLDRPGARASTLDGDEVVVKVQYPGVPRRWTATCAARRCCCRCSSGSRPTWTPGRCSPSCASASAKSSTTSSRPSSSAGSSAFYRGHPFIFVPRVRTDSQYPTRARLGVRRGRALRGGSRTRPGTAGRYGEIVFRFFFALLYRNRIALGDPHPGNYLLRPDGRVAFLDYGLVRDFGAARIDAERAMRSPYASRRRGARSGARRRRVR